MTLAENILFAVLGTLLMVFAGFGCSSTGGGHPTLQVFGSMSEAEARGWIEQGAVCLGFKAQTWGTIYTVKRPGNRFDYTWTTDGEQHTIKNIGGVYHVQPDGSAWLHYTDYRQIKLHELGWHHNKIKKHHDYSEPPGNWCALMRGMVEEDVGRVVVIGPDGEIK